MDPFKIIQKYYNPGSKSYRIMVHHAEEVAARAIQIGKNIIGRGMDLDINFIEQAAILHDIGIFLTDAPNLGCTGSNPYICHGYLGRQLLDNEGYPRHGLVCERHVGAGLSKQAIIREQLPIPPRDMNPVSIEEQIICYADKFFSKSADSKTNKEKTPDQIIKELSGFNADQVKQFKTWLKLFDSDIS